MKDFTQPEEEKMKIILTKEYELEVRDADHLKQLIYDAVTGGASIILDEETWNKRREEGWTGYEADWADVKDDMEKEFYHNYPKHKVNVSFPPSTLEDYARITAIDLNEGIIEEGDVFEEDNTEITWTIREGSSPPHTLSFD